MTTNCLTTKPHKSILGIFALLDGVLAVLVGILAILVSVLGVLCIGMVYLLHETEHSKLGWCIFYFHLKNVRISFLYSLNEVSLKHSLSRSLRKNVRQLEKVHPRR